MPSPRAGRQVSGAPHGSRGDGAGAPGTPRASAGLGPRSLLAMEELHSEGEQLGRLQGAQGRPGAELPTARPAPPHLQTARTPGAPPRPPAAALKCCHAAPA